MREGTGNPQTALLLGGGSEIGLATVRRLIDEGCREVVLAARRPSELDHEVDALLAAGARGVDTVTYDASDPGQHAATIEKAVACVGDLDVVLVAFGVLGHQGAYDLDPELAARDAALNFAGAVAASLAAVQRLRHQGHGTLVLFSSVAGTRVRADNPVYGGAKAGLDGFATGLAARLEGTGVRILVVRPGFVHSRMTAGRPPAPFATSPEHVAEAVVRGLGGGATVVWVPGVLRSLFAALRVLPEPLWRRVSKR